MEILWLVLSGGYIFLVMGYSMLLIPVQLEMHSSIAALAHVLKIFAPLISLYFIYWYVYIFCSQNYFHTWLFLLFDFWLFVLLPFPPYPVCICFFAHFQVVFWLSSSLVFVWYIILFILYFLFILKPCGICFLSVSFNLIIIILLLNFLVIVKRRVVWNPIK